MSGINAPIVRDQRTAQRILVSPDMKPFALSPYLRELQSIGQVDLSTLIAISDNTLAFLSGAPHQALRQLLAKPFAAAALQARRPLLMDITDQALAHIAAYTTLDMIAEFTDPLYVQMLEQLFGVVIPDTRQFLLDVDIATTITEPMQSIRHLKQVDDAFRRINALVDRCRQAPPTGSLINDIHQAWKSQPESTLTAQQVTILISTMMIGARTTSETLANIILATSLGRAHIARLMSQQAWVDQHIEDLVRFCASTEYLTRISEQALELPSLPLAAGRQVLIHVPSANRDPDYYQHTSFDEIAACKEQRHLGFGAGNHRCPGAALARITLSCVLPRLYRDFPTLNCDSENIGYKNSTLAKRLSSLPVRLQTTTQSNSTNTN